jgi:hypothetical protein
VSFVHFRLHATSIKAEERIFLFYDKKSLLMIKLDWVIDYGVQGPLIL